MNIFIVSQVGSTKPTKEVELDKPMDKYPVQFITLKWVKKGETKDFLFYNEILNKFREHGSVITVVYGPDSLGRPHIHFAYKQNHFVKYKALVPKFCHFHFKKFEPYHLTYMQNHKLIK